MSDFKLSAVLKGHEDDVKGITFPTRETLLSASRDATVRSWRLKSSSPPEYDETIVSHGSAFINAIAYLPPSNDFPEGLIISGGKDTIIEVRQPGRPPDVAAERMLLGHQGNVCALDAFADGAVSYVVSGSWDSSAKVWDVNKGESTATLEGHEGSVWAVLGFDRERIVTACADHTIRIFSTSGQLLNTLKGSKDVVRALCRLPDKNAWGAQFASAGNDAVIRLWTMGGKQVAQLEGHDSFIYSLTLLPTGELVSSGEDRTVKVWRDRDCIQTITHPATSVWTVAVCAETGDIASGASDRIVRIFSRSPERHANKETIEVFNASVEGSSIPKQTVGNGDIKKDNLPGPDFLKKKVGTREGQVQMILQYNGNVTAHTWSHMAQEWINVGTVVDAAGSTGRRQEYMGQDYDYVFDIDVAEGQPPLKLPYNSSDNPYEVARKFIADHELPTGYVDQVSNFIITNTQSTSFDQQSTTQTPQPAPSTRPKVLPQKEYSTITTANFGIISRKIQELNAQLLSSGKKDMAFSPSDLKLIPDFISALESALAATSSSSTSLSPSQTQTLDTGAVLLTKIITAWPHAMRIPGLDLYRCLTACHPPTDTLATLKASGAFPFHAPADSPSNPNMLMLALRALANLFATDAGRHIAQQNGEGNVSEALELVAPCVEPASAGANNRNVHIAATTFCVNYAVLLLSSSSSSATSAETPSSNTNDTSVTITTTTTKTTPEASTARTLLSPLSSLLSSPKVLDSETIYRALVAVGTLARVPGAKDEELSKLLGEAVAAAGKRCKEPRVAGVVGEILV